MMKAILQQTFIKKVYYYPQLGSTNQQAIELIRAGVAPVPSLVITDCQTRGRGRGHNSWWSGVGSLAFTVIFKPAKSSLSVCRFSTIPLVVGFSLRRTIQAYLSGRLVTLKWPNDILVDGKKICGILCENEQGYQKQHYLLVGIGINVNDPRNGAPEELQSVFVSLYELLGVKNDKEELLINCLENMEMDLRRFSGEGFLYFRDKWSDFDYLLNKIISINYESSVATGKYLGLSESGGVLIDEDGQLNEYISGEVKVVRD